MEATKICPICGKTDIPNFLEKDVVCPCCGTDLSVYRKLQLAKEAAEKPSSKMKRKLVYIIVALLAIVVIILAVNSVIIHSQNKKLLSKNEKIESLTTERDSLLVIVSNLPLSPEEMKKEEDIYIVKKGDSFCRISKILYGTEQKAQEIAEHNDLTLKYVLQPGDTLKVKK